MTQILPAIFFGHGSPMNALQSNRYTEAWRHFGKTCPKPRSILMVSAHWYVNKCAVTTSLAPRTIHDFGGFPAELYRVHYPAPGDQDLAQRVQKLLSPIEVLPDDSWGLDHGTWSVLRHVYPDADVPVVQLSIDASQPASVLFGIGQALTPLREEGVLIAGSGNVVHNLGLYDWSGKAASSSDWASRFEQRVKQLILAEDHESLIQYQSLGSDAMRSVPTPEHYLPLLFVLGSRVPSDTVRFPVEGIEGGSLSMLSVELTGN